MTQPENGDYQPTSWEWDFGDFQKSTLQNPTHQYIIPNDYVVTLIAGKYTGEQSCTRTKEWTVRELLRNLRLK